MTQADQVAKTFCDVRAGLAMGYGVDVATWDELDPWAKRFLVSVFDLMLERHDIARGKRSNPRDSVPSWAQVRSDLGDIARLTSGLFELYRLAHDDLEGSGAGDGVGGRGLHDVDPTKEHTFDVRRTAERADVGGAGRAIADARNGLYSARETLQALVVGRGYGQERRERIKPDSKALISEGDLRESLDAQDKRARGTG